MRLESCGRMLAAALAIACAAPAMAADINIDGKVLRIKDTKLFKFVARPASGGTFPLPAIGGTSDPLSNGGDVDVHDEGNIYGDLFDGLVAGVWSGLGDPPGSTGYKYKNLAAPHEGAVKTIILTERVIKIHARDDGTLDGPVSGRVQVILQTGGDRYCAIFGGTTIQNIPGVVKLKDAPAPAECAIGVP